jgi:hypothetical protein
VTAALGAIYPVGSIYVNAAVSTNPNTLLGFGTWEAFGAGRVMVGFNASDALFDTLEETGGSKDAVVVSHTHTATSASTLTDPGHTHDAGAWGGAFADNGIYVQTARQATGQVIGGTTGTRTTGISVATTTIVASAGVSGTNANVQPYITVRMWKRTA